ncbi:DNA-binding SARP family transcriptional activator/tetratricopeptide (TPR) repeat protein [Streptosporangium album]|uniref:DNA-binding SARP family transcriptional activator/tetratricopeptide (TPR) repeat protein n=1 Tax=Streptosporangium album TaxID=47479 RepID=A0A7W7S2B5_9ACTN|nr:AfsR/SARP family transcriptional regulator [Streptosporangium album]MBB4941918.1 DNA-binding SARP family transcriptional activator/tetratricopeptide (TPR) repeat protein [Streptosporangium album]
MVLIRVLGSFGAEVNGESVPLGGPRQRGVLALLVAARGQVVSVDRMIEDLWRGEPPSRALASLQAYVSNLRRLLEPGRPPRTPARLLVSASPGYALRLPPKSVDAWRFEDLLDEARTLTEPQAARARLAEALGLWQGPAFAEVADEPWAAAETARLNELRLVARELHVAAGLRTGDPASVVPEAERLTRDEPLREEGWRLHALALWSSARQADALATLRRARATFADELGLDPGPDLVALEEAILAQRIDILRTAVPPPPATTPPHDASPHDARLHDATLHRAASFVGREGELAALVSAAGEAAADGARVALVTGEAGLGKSTLLEHLGAQLERDGWLVAAGRCPEVDGAPPAWAWVEALRAVAATVPPGEFAEDLAPLLSDSMPVDSDAAAGRFRLRRAVWGWLAAAATERPVAVVLDDLHWADTTTLGLLGGGVGVRAPILVVAAYRPDESEHLTETLGALARTAPLRIALPGLDGAAVAELVRAESEADDATVAGIAERTGGNPFYVRESARLLNGEGALVALSEVPEGVRDVLRRRLARLPESGVSVLRLAAVAGRESSVDVLVQAADSDGDGVLDALDAGVIAGLLDEPGPGRVRFVHALVRDTLVADVSRLRAARMHARIAAALEGTGDVAALAHHYARAGSPKAVGYCVRAAELAEARYAHDVAAALLTDAVANSSEPDERVGLLGRLLRAQIRAGAVAAARDTREQAVEYAESIGRDDLMIAAFTAWTEPTPWQARTYGTVDRPIVGRLSRLLKRTGLAPDVRSRLLIAYANELVGEDDPTVMAAAREALDLATDPRLRAAALLVLASDPGREEYSRELVEIGVEHDLPVYRVTGLLNQAANAAAANDPATMRRVTGEALDLARAYRMPEAIGAVEIALATLVLIEGRFADAERLYVEATERMERAGSVHAGFVRLALAAIWLNDGTLGDHLDDVRALHEALGPMVADLLALALHAAGRSDEARRARTSPGPIRPDFFFAFLTTLRAMAVIALNDTALNDTGAAEECYAALLPHRDGPPAGATSLSLAVRPAAHTLGELALLLGRDDEAAAHFARAAAIADRWNAPHWSAPARAHL